MSRVNSDTTKGKPEKRKPTQTQESPSKKLKQDRITSTTTTTWPTPDFLSPHHHMRFQQEISHQLTEACHLLPDLVRLITSYHDSIFLFVWERMMDFLSYYHLNIPIFTIPTPISQPPPSPPPPAGRSIKIRNAIPVPTTTSTLSIYERILIWEEKMTTKLKEFMNKDKMFASEYRAAHPQLFESEWEFQYRMPPELREALCFLSEHGLSRKDNPLFTSSNLWPSMDKLEAIIELEWEEYNSTFYCLWHVHAQHASTWLKYDLLSGCIYITGLDEDNQFIRDECIPRVMFHSLTHLLQCAMLFAYTYRFDYFQQFQQDSLPTSITPYHADETIEHQCSPLIFTQHVCFVSMEYIHGSEWLRENIAVTCENDTDMSIRFSDSDRLAGPFPRTTIDLINEYILALEAQSCEYHMVEHQNERGFINDIHLMDEEDGYDN